MWEGATYGYPSRKSGPRRSTFVHCGTVRDCAGLTGEGSVLPDRREWHGVVERSLTALLERLRPADSHQGTASNPTPATRAIATISSRQPSHSGTSGRSRLHDGLVGAAWLAMTGGVVLIAIAVETAGAPT